ncbi:PQQ-dependent sugar dehydrogenase [Polymorphospora rubra]|uniref:PQQ-dependent sugar dehydrogenase n=1 Tax=Polymorphospora rubra TaxID=338584 RepID=UPI0033D09AAD
MNRKRWTPALALAVTLAVLPGPAYATPDSAPPGAAALPLDRVRVTTTQLAFGLQRPTAIAAPDDGSDRLLITEKAGRIRVYHPTTGLAATPLLDITDRVAVSGNERGLLGIETAPDFAQSGALYLAYTAVPDGALTLSRFVLAGGAATEQVILTQSHAEYANHNGGEVKFGADGHLYWSLGDGGSAGDPFDAGQRLDTLLGKIVRLDVSRSCGGQPYCVPADNPFVGVAGARAEIWAFGLRNPWRFSFDAQDGSLWIADVGQGTYEEIDHLPADGGGANFGWSCREGPAVFDLTRCRAGATYTDPVFHYRTSFEGCAVIGGFVYRGQQYADLVGGTYIASDYCSATAWAIRPGAPGAAYDNRVIGELPIQPTSFGEDADGELYLVNDLPGQLHKIGFEAVPAPAACAVTYTVDDQWGSNFRSTVTLTNTGTAPLDGWSLAWSFDAGQRIGGGWSAALTQQGSTVTATNLSWNRVVAPGATVTFGFLGTYSGANPAPTAFTLGGAACRT